MSADTNLFDSPSARFWKEALAGKMPETLAHEIDVFETEIKLKKQGKIDDKVFAETRLRRGAYGQRYDNGRRYDGTLERTIDFPNRDKIFKGPGTQWDAPGMLRIKIPYGGLTTAQLDLLADIAEEYSDGILHVTTRQDFQLHFVHIEDMPVIFRRLASVGITTREACGNTVRNVTACPLAGVCTGEAFDVTPYAKALTYFLLGHPDTQDFGRKFKFAFSGCATEPCALVSIHDMGFIAVTKTVNGKTVRGFQTFVGGGLGALPYQAQLFDDFVPEGEILPLAQAVCRIFARFGEKQKRNRARVKFLVSDWGIEKFKQTVLEERTKLAPDARWTDFLKTLEATSEHPLKPAGNSAAGSDPAYQNWFNHNIKAQRQEGFSVVRIALPLGDLSANQTRGLAAVAKEYVNDTIRTTIEQNIVLRWVSNTDLPAVYAELKNLQLVKPFVGTVVDVTACPGTDTCKLGVSSSRGLASELHRRLAEKSAQLDTSVMGLRIKISGCFNSCGQHHVADLGFYGVSRKVGNYMIPHFQVLLGGQFSENGGSYGQAIVAIPSKAIPKAVDALTQWYVQARAGEEAFADFITRQGKIAVKQKLDPFTVIPPYATDPDFYKDWGDVREYSKKDIGIGECAGEVVSATEFGLTSADRKLFEAQIQLDKGEHQTAALTAYAAMLEAAHALVKGKNPFAPADTDKVIAAFKELFCDTKLFFDPFQGDKFANFFFKATKTELKALRPDQVRLFIEEAQLFIEAAYSCNVRTSMGPGMGANQNLAT